MSDLVGWTVIVVAALSLPVAWAVAIFVAGHSPKERWRLWRRV
jgi:hypothetical protein